MLVASQGRIGLHCAVSGGARLFDFYAKHCKLLNLDQSFRRVGIRQSDGRCFHSDAGLAEALLHELDAMR